MKSVPQPIICFLLTINTESINRGLSTMEDRWRIQLQLQLLSGRLTTSPLSMLFQAINIKPEEAPKSLSTDTGLSSASDNNSRAPFDSPLPSNNSTPSDVVALNRIYHPSGKILLSFVSDRNGFLPPESWFENEDCELLMECWKWLRCKNNFLAQKLVEIKDLPDMDPVARGTSKVSSNDFQQIVWVPHDQRGNSFDSGLGSNSSSSTPLSRDMSENKSTFTSVISFMTDAGNSFVDYTIIEMSPNVVGLSGAPFCDFLGLAELFLEVQSGYAIVEGLLNEIRSEKGNKDGKGDHIPPSPDVVEKTVIILLDSWRNEPEARLHTNIHTFIDAP